MASKLVFLDDRSPGITRRMLRGKWAYFGPDGTRISDPAEISRLNAVALPPAYENAWFAPCANAHLLAVGYDAKGRKQYRYHPGYRLERETRKFDLCRSFGLALPELRKRVASDLRKRKLTRERAIASVVALLDTGAIRVGNEAYAKRNKSYGATTLRNRHATLDTGTLTLRFRGKGGKLQEIACSDRALLRCVRTMQDLPGQHLFKFAEPDGAVIPVSSDDVNLYLRETTGDDFTARNFRTWTASALAFDLFWHCRDMTLKDLLEHVSKHLGNTPAIARKSYVHPVLIAAAKGEDDAPALPLRLPRKTRWLERAERGLIDYLEHAPSAARWSAGA